MTLLDGWLATTILVALVLTATLGWWWADPLAAIALALVAVRESVELFRSSGGDGAEIASTSRPSSSGTAQSTSEA
jgi:divalent metal cation (Fe/Co/Zn/Cd) transporter